MKGKLLFVAGLATGYVLGTRAGRERYEQIASAASSVWNAAPVQSGVDSVKSFALARVGDVGGTVLDGAKRVLNSVTKAAGSDVKAARQSAATATSKAADAAAKAVDAAAAEVDAVVTEAEKPKRAPAKKAPAKPRSTSTRTTKSTSTSADK